MSEVVWIITTVPGREDYAVTCADFARRAGLAQPLLVVDQGWGLGGSMEWARATFPDASAYGWLADDTRPRTIDFAHELEEAAGYWNIAYPRDNWISEDAGGPGRLAQGWDLTSGVVWGGELVRAVGWWALPGVRQAGIDTAWTEIVRPLKLYRYVPDVLVEHLHWRNGRRPKDKYDDGPWIAADLAYRNSDACKKEISEARARVAAARNLIFCNSVDDQGRRCQQNEQPAHAHVYSSTLESSRETTGNSTNLT